MFVMAAAIRSKNCLVYTLLVIFSFSTKEVKELYGELVNEFAFSVDQLLELSGFSCAVAIAKVCPCCATVQFNLFVYIHEPAVCAICAQLLTFSRRPVG